MDYSITKEQLRKLTDPQVKEWFPEAFLQEKTGWYKDKRFSEWLMFLDFENKKCYGFNMYGSWYNSFFDLTTRDLDSKFEFPATEEEVFEALKNEAVKRGFVEGAYFKNACDEEGKICKLKGDRFKYGWFGRVNLHETASEGIIFESGKWAEIIPTIKKSEAEKLLNKKIID